MKTKSFLRLLTSRRKEAVWVVFFLFLISPFLLIRFFVRLIRKNKDSNKSYEEAIKTLSPYEFEHFVANLFKKQGYQVKVTSPSNDYGIDIIARNDTEILAIQVKKYNDVPVGNREVQMLLGAMQKKGVKADKSILITTSHFTKKAKIQAEDCPIELWDGDKLKNLVSDIQKIDECKK